MADEPDNMVLTLLRDIRAKQDEQSRTLQDHSKQLEELRETALLGVGLAAVANHKLDRLTDRVDGHERRLDRLEHEPRPAA